MGERHALSIVEGTGQDPGGDLGPVLTADELAARWKITPKQVRGLARAGKIPGFRLGTFWRFNLAEVVAWERSQ